MHYAYGVTTVPERRETLLPRTLESLQKAGFPSPRLFIDGDSDPAKYQHFGHPLTLHQPKLGICGNWYMALWELFLRNPRAHRYIIFQDDLVCYRNLRAYLDRSRLPARAYFNLYTEPRNQNLCPEGHIGWFEADQQGRGAVALMFNFTAMSVILNSAHMVNSIHSPAKDHTYHDGRISRAFRDARFTEYAHSPSLCSHTGGDVSTWKNRPPCEASFRGEDFDATHLISEAS